jgi:phenylalanyl-tRNA synthetase beta chain
MGHHANDIGNGIILVDIGAWRSDILHEVDLIEDVAVGYGFDQFPTDLPKSLTFGGRLSSQTFYDGLRSIMIGLGFNEVTTFVISNKDDEFQRMGLQKKEMVELENPIGEEYSGLRMSLLPSLLKLLRENRHHPLPQQIFEVGVVVDETAKTDTISQL